MIIVDNIVKADDGKLLLVNGDYRHEVHLGEEMILRDNKWTSQINSLDDIEEVTYTLFIDKHQRRIIMVETGENRAKKLLGLHARENELAKLEEKNNELDGILKNLKESQRGK